MRELVTHACVSGSFQGNAEVYGETEKPVSPLYRGLCDAFWVTKKYFEMLVADRWDDVEQLKKIWIVIGRNMC